MKFFKGTSPELRRLIENLVNYCRQHDEQVLTKVEIENKGFVSGDPGKGLIICIYAKSKAVDDIFNYTCQRLGVEANEPTGQYWTGEQK
jgi:hypothetical protein